MAQIAARNPAARTSTMTPSTISPSRASFLSRRDGPMPKAKLASVESLHFHVRVLDHLTPFRGLRADAFGEGVGRAHQWEDEARGQELLLKSGIAEDALRFRIELHHDVARRALGRRQRIPGPGLVARQPALRQRRHVGILRDALWTAEAEHLEPASLPRLPDEPDADDHHLDVAADQVGDGGRRAAVVHRGEPGAGHAFQEDDVEVPARADAERAV